MDGSFIVVPLKDRKKRVFGLLGLDTLNDVHSRSIFITHEIQFFQVSTQYPIILCHLISLLNDFASIDNQLNIINQLFFITWQIWIA